MKHGYVTYGKALTLTYIFPSDEDTGQNLVKQTSKEGCKSLNKNLLQ